MNERWLNNQLNRSKGARRFIVVILFLLLFGLVMGGAGTAVAQQPVTPLYTQEFDGIGTSQTATVPTNWRVDRPSTARTVGTWASASTATTQRGGNSLSTTAANGIYNFGAGDATTATDRAIGWLSSGTGTQSGNLYLQMINNTGAVLNSIAISYDVEKYRQGSNAAGFRIQLYYSFDGVNWTDAGAAFLTNFPADFNNNGYATAPGVIVPVTGVLNFASPIGTDATFYLAWNYSVTSGTTFTNAQALAVDNVIVSPIINLTPNDTPAWLSPGWQFWALADVGFGNAVCVEVHPVGDPGNYIRSRCEYDEDTGPDGSNWRCEIFTDGVPAPFQSAIVEYQFLRNDWDAGSTCPGSDWFTGFNWSFETGPTAVNLSTFSANTALPLLLIVAIGLLLGGTALLTQRRKG